MTHINFALIIVLIIWSLTDIIGIRELNDRVNALEQEKQK